MTKRFNKIAAMCAAATMASSFIVGVSAATDTEKTISGYAWLENVKVTYSNTVEQTKAKATTSIANDNAVTVSGSYTYINVDTLEVKTITNGNGERRSASVVFYAPTNCVTIKLISNHYASNGVQNWSATDVKNIR